MKVSDITNISSMTLNAFWDALMQKVSTLTKGAKGDPGQTPKIVMGSVTKLSPDAQPSATLVPLQSDPNTYTLNLQLPQGVQGEQGLQGIPGVGSKGLDGNNGLTPTIDPKTKHWMIGGADTGVIAEGQAGKDAGDISDLKGEIAGARGRFADMADREDAQDAAIAEIKSYGLATTNIRKQISYNGYWSNLDQSHSGGVYTSSLDTIKNDIDQMAPLVDGVTLLFHQYITGGKLVVLEDLDTFKQAIDYAKSKGLIIVGYKFHCTTSIDDIKSYGVSEFFADYKANVDKVTSALPETGVPLILFNERGDLYSASSPYSGNVHNVLQDLVSASYKVDISFQSLQDFINADPHVQEIVDSILINSYPMISDKNRETTLPDIVTGIDVNFYNSALYVHSLYPQKPLIMSEFGIKNNWAAFDETCNWNFSSVYDDPTGKVYYLYLRGLMQSETIKLFDGVWLWFYADLLQSDAGKEYLRAYKKGVI